jgi:hypothetical protein
MKFSQKVIMRKLLLITLILIPIKSLSSNSWIFPDSSSDSFKPATLRNTFIFSAESYTKSSTIHGGDYFSISYDRRLFYKVELGIKYSADIVPESFKDNLFTLSLCYNPARYVNGVHPSISIIYMIDSSEGFVNSNYFGTKICLANKLYELPKNALIVEALGFSFLYDPKRKDFVFCYDLISIGFRF